MFENSIKKLEMLEQLVSITGNPEIEAMSKFLYERIKHHDSYVVFLGETSSGKSSVINGLLRSPILPMKANPSTAAITEIELDTNISDDEFYAINKNATIEKLDYSIFLQLSENPDENLRRLKVKKNIGKSLLDNVRIFDTPGYGSIVAEHEEVLKEFLPNSDIIVYLVNYKIGIQDEDYIFLGFLRELIREDVKIYLLVNRCPVGIDSESSKVKNISSFVSDVLSIEPEVFILHNMEVKEGDGHPLPHNNELWSSISKELTSPNRLRSLELAFDIYIEDLYHRCFNIIESRYLSAIINKEEFEAIRKIQKESADRILHTIPKFVVPVFDKIENGLTKKFEEVKNNVVKKVFSEIDTSGRIGMEEMVAYTNVHLLPYTIKSETSEVQRYIDIELDNLNRQVDDYLQKERIRFNNDVTAQIQTNVGAATSSIVAGIVKEVGKNSLEGYFVAFGGMGGANAGIANAASHLLKRAGNLFGHTFSRATHNGLRHFLAKIGATSMKVVGVAVAVVVELLFDLYEFTTWKGKLKDKVSDGLEKWQKETLNMVKEDLAKLREENVQTIRKIADDIAHTFDDVKSENIDECIEHYIYAQQIGEKMGIK